MSVKWKLRPSSATPVRRTPRPPGPGPSRTPSPGLSPPGCGEEDIVCPARSESKKEEEKDGGEWDRKRGKKNRRRGRKKKKVAQDLKNMVCEGEVCFCVSVRVSACTISQYLVLEVFTGQQPQKNNINPNTIGPVYQLV